MIGEREGLGDVRAVGILETSLYLLMCELDERVVLFAQLLSQDLVVLLANNRFSFLHLKIIMSRGLINVLMIRVQFMMCLSYHFFTNRVDLAHCEQGHFFPLGCLLLQQERRLRGIRQCGQFRQLCWRRCCRRRVADS